MIRTSVVELLGEALLRRFSAAEAIRSHTDISAFWLNARLREQRVPLRRIGRPTWQTSTTLTKHPVFSENHLVANEVAFLLRV